MQSKLHGNVVHHGVELLLLVSMLFLLAIPKSLLILKEFLYTCTIYCTVMYCQYLFLHSITLLTLRTMATLERTLHME